MPLFNQNSNIAIYGGTFNEVAGNINLYLPPPTVQRDQCHPLTVLAVYLISYLTFINLSFIPSFLYYTVYDTRLEAPFSYLFVTEAYVHPFTVFYSSTNYSVGYANR
jgi:hypothetical protein